MRNKYIYLTLAVLISSSFAKTDSPSEWVNYEQIKDAYSKADAELNSVYKQQIQEYKKEGGGVMDRVNHVIYTLKNHN
ncbi:hypothetical protein ACOY7G_11215 [Enterobacter bugandensis]